MKFSALFRPTALFSLRDSNSTSSGAKSLLLPSPYSIKMALISQAISLGGEDFEKQPNNVKDFDANCLCAGIIQEYDDFDKSLCFDNVNNYSNVKTKRYKKLLVLPLSVKSSSKSYTSYKLIK
jgi:hypothetical protein